MVQQGFFFGRDAKPIIPASPNKAAEPINLLRIIIIFILKGKYLNLKNEKRENNAFFMLVYSVKLSYVRN